jgi:hypothetical protein
MLRRRRAGRRSAAPPSVPKARVAAATEADAIARRITQLYTKAVERPLGSTFWQHYDCPGGLPGRRDTGGPLALYAAPPVPAAISWSTVFPFL